MLCLCMRFAGLGDVLALNNRGAALIAVARTLARHDVAGRAFRLRIRAAVMRRVTTLGRSTARAASNRSRRLGRRDRGSTAHGRIAVAIRRAWRRASRTGRVTLMSVVQGWREDWRRLRTSVQDGTNRWKLEITAVRLAFCQRYIRPIRLTLYRESRAAGSGLDS